MASSREDPSVTAPLYLPTSEAYDLWAPYYDTDGNFLQILDSHLLEQLLPEWLASLPVSPNIIDLGCGTGRQTVRLLSFDGAEVIGLDLSPRMLEIARRRCSQVMNSLAAGSGTPKAKNVDFALFDILNSPSSSNQPSDQLYTQKLIAEPSVPSGIDIHSKCSTDAILSTLVLEHVPLRDFFAYCAYVLRPGATLLITNMAEDMGRVSQAGFREPSTGKKIRPKSFTHGVEQTVREARLHGFSVHGDVQERDVREEDIETLKLGERGKKWIGVKVVSKYPSISLSLRL